MAVTAAYVSGKIVVRMESGAELRFPVADSPRLARGKPRQLNLIELSPFGRSGDATKTKTARNLIFADRKWLNNPLT